MSNIFDKDLGNYDSLPPALQEARANEIALRHAIAGALWDFTLCFWDRERKEWVKGYRDTYPRILIGTFGDLDICLRRKAPDEEGIGDRMFTVRG